MELEDMVKNAREAHVPVLLDDSACFLAKFCDEHKPKNILEIGTAVGYSGIIMLLNSGNESMLTTIEKNEEMFMRAKHNFQSYNIEPRTMQYLGDAEEILPWLDEKYDLIFLDGPKGQYLKYYAKLKSLLTNGGYLIADNVYYHGLVKSQDPITHKHRTIVTKLREFNKLISEDKSVSTEFVEVGDGIAVVKKISD